jgi:hypothetical protein
MLSIVKLDRRAGSAKREWGEVFEWRNFDQFWKGDEALKAERVGIERGGTLGCGAEPLLKF